MYRSEIQDQVADFSSPEIIGSHFGDHEDFCGLGCDPVQSGRCFVVCTCPYPCALFKIKRNIFMGYSYLKKNCWSAFFFVASTIQEHTIDIAFLLLI
jgi:hypothetical protein